MSEWIKKARQNPPKNMTLVLVKGFDCLGEWTQEAMRKDYIRPPIRIGKRQAKKGFRKGFRWVDKKGMSLKDQHVCEWKPII